MPPPPPPQSWAICILSTLNLYWTNPLGPPIFIMFLCFFAGIHAIAPPIESLLDDHLLASSNNPAILEQLQCPIHVCLRILHQPLELPCTALVCTACMVEWFKVFNCSGVKCPCCFMDTPLTAPQLTAAPLIDPDTADGQALQCQTCRKDIKACEYGPHQCNGEPTNADL